jgi:ABC-type Fe3+ transport system permease subunit
MHFLRIRSVFISFLALIISLPVLALIASWLEWNSSSAQVLLEMLQTVLPNYISTSLWLCLGVAIGVSLLGTSLRPLSLYSNFRGKVFLNGLCYCRWQFLPMLSLMRTQISSSLAGHFKISFGQHGVLKAVFFQKLEVWVAPWWCSR